MKKAGPGGECATDLRLGLPPRNRYPRGASACILLQSDPVAA